MSDKNKGLYNKFVVRRTDGSSEQGGKHEHCDYFVLDLSHDKHAIPALRAYAESCEPEYKALADDLFLIAEGMESKLTAQRPAQGGEHGAS